MLRAGIIAALSPPFLHTEYMLILGLSRPAYCVLTDRLDRETRTAERWDSVYGP